MINNFCTHSDINYLEKGLVLYKSLYTQNQNLTLWYLCTDDQTFEKLAKLNLPGIMPIELKQLEKQDSLLSSARSNPASQFGTQYSQFCWTLTPYFIYWLLKNKIIQNDSLLYCDADLCFYHNPEAIYHQIGNADVGIHRHRFTSYNVDTNPVGEFNVGCVYFKNTTTGFKIAREWKDWLLNPNNQYYEKYGTCGDQKYLDLFIPLFGKSVCIFDADDSGIAHGAPWNFDQYKYLSFDNVLYKDKPQTILFNHFSHFTPNFETNTWSSSDHGEWKPEDGRPEVLKYYQNYWLEIQAARQLLYS